MSTSLAGWCCAVAAAAALVLAWPARSRVTTAVETVSAASPPDDDGWMRRFRPAWSLLAAIAVLTFLGGRIGLVAAPVVGAVVWTVVGRAETPAARRRREQVRRDLPHVVSLLASALRSGAGPAEAVVAVARALPGPAADRLLVVHGRLLLGGDPAGVWAELGRDADLGPLGRTLARAQRSGAPVVAAVERLAEELARTARGEVEDRARAVGVKAAVPLGLCLLPAFVLVGIVPLAASLLSTLIW